MRAVALDRERLAQLRVFDESERHEIASGAAEAIAEQLKLIDTALADSDHRSAAAAAHRARGEALMLGALELCEALARLEEAARQGDKPTAMAGASDAHAAWPGTRRAILEFAGRLDAA